MENISQQTIQRHEIVERFDARPPSPPTTKTQAERFADKHNAEVRRDRALAELTGPSSETAPTVQSPAADLSPLTPNTEEAIAFLEALDRDGRHDLVAINPELPDKHPEKICAGTFYFPAQKEDARAWIDSHQGRVNIYYSVNRGRSDAPRNHRLDHKKRAELSFIRAIVGDFDLKKAKPGETPPSIDAERMRLAKLATELSASECPPTMMVDSGGGLQAIWMLTAPLSVDPESAATAEGVGHAIKKRYGGDAVWDVARIMRLPGTINVLSPEKRKSGRTAALAKIIECGERCSIKQLAAWAPPIASSETTSIQDWTKVPIDMEEVEWVQICLELPPNLHQKFDALCAERPIVAALWGGIPAPGQIDISASGFEFALVRELKRNGFTPTECTQIIAVYPHRSEKHADDLRRRVARAWNRCGVANGSEGFESCPMPPPKDQPPGAKPADDDAPGDETDEALGLGDKPKHVRSATAVEPFEASSLPPRPWILTNLACRNLVSIVTGLAGASKSTYSFPLALAAITGREDIAGFRVQERTRVWLWNQEDDLQEMRRRLLAAMQTHNVSWDDLRDENGDPMLFMDSGVDSPMMLAIKKDSAVRGTKDLAAAIETVHDRGIGLLILDPLVEFHEAEENSNMEMRAVLGCVRSISVSTGCAAVVVAHTGKPPRASSKSYAGDPNSVRGAYAQVGTARIVATVYAAAKEDEKDWILPGGFADYVRVDIAKNNLGPKPTVWLKRNVQLVGDERVAMVRPVTIQPVVKEGRPDTLSGFARVLASMKAFKQPTPLASLLELVPELTDADKSALATFRTRTRWLDTAFGGKDVTQWLTDDGLLVRSAGKGKAGTMLSLTPTAGAELQEPDGEEEVVAA